ncbi:MAG: hypothetical protein ACREYA_11700 [Cupriavidus necator]
MRKHFPQRAIIASLIGSLLSACAVSPQAVSEAERQTRESVAREQQRLNDQAQAAPLVEIVDANYLGADPIPLSPLLSLPRAFTDKQIQLLGVRNLKDHAEKIAAVGGFAVRIAQDVWRVPASRGGANKTAAPAMSAAAPLAPNGRPVPSSSGMPPGSPMAAPTPTPQSVALAAVTNYADPAVVRMEYTGNLGGAMAALTVPLGLSWEYSRQDNVVTISRFVTRKFAVRSGGTSEMASDIDKGTTANSGTSGTGTGGSSASGNFTAGGKFRTESGKLDPIGVVAKTIRDNYLTDDGTVTPDATTNSVVVTDSRYVIDQVAAYMEQQNATLSKQAQVTFRTITLQINDTSEIGFDVSAVYSKLLNGAAEWALSSAAPATVTGSQAGNVSFNVLSPTSRWNGSSVSVKQLEGLGKILGDNTKTLVSKNGKSVGRIEFDSDAYLAETKAGGGTLAGSSVPGLTPGTQTVGTALMVRPIIYDSNAVELEMSMDESFSRGFRTASAGSGQTFQQLELPRESGNKSISNVEVRDGASLVLVGYDNQKVTADRRYGLTGVSNSALKSRIVTIVIVTPRVLPGA